MTQSSGAPIKVIDANIAIWAVVPEVARGDAVGLLERLRGDGARLVAPTLWLAECTSTIRSLAFLGVLATSRAKGALENLLALEVEMQPIERPLCLAAFAWAERLNQRRASDGFYLAVAEGLGTELWTADQRLARSAQAAGASWVHALTLWAS